MRYQKQEWVDEVLEGDQELYNLALGTAVLTPPVGSVIILATEKTPNDIGYGGMWEQYAKGTTLIGVDSDQVEFDALDKIGGTKTHTLSEKELPVVTVGQNQHSHAFAVRFAAGSDTNAFAFNAIGNSNPTQAAVAGNTAGSTATNKPFGGGRPHNNLPPYTAAYFWKRIA